MLVLFMLGWKLEAQILHIAKTVFTETHCMYLYIRLHIYKNSLFLGLHRYLHSSKVLIHTHLIPVHNKHL